MSSVQVDKTGRCTIGIPHQIVKAMGIEKGDIAHVMRGEKENEIKIVIEKL
jgi:bifunctional DNA-binding transcriptional regulator/antitoxin component of YhaV-PrlF toxin-antitoxin module